MIKTYKMRRPSRIGTQTRNRDELVPEAHLWRLVDGMVRSGRLWEVKVPEADFQAAVAKYCPENAAELYTKLGLKPLEVPNEKVRGRSRSTRTILGTPPVPIDAGV